MVGSVPTASEERGSAISITLKRRPGPITPGRVAGAARGMHALAHRRRRRELRARHPAAERLVQRLPDIGGHAEEQAVNGRELERRIVDVLDLDQREAARMIDADRSLDALPERLGGRQRMIAVADAKSITAVSSGTP